MVRGEGEGRRGEESGGRGVYVDRKRGKYMYLVSIRASVHVHM